MDVVSLVNKAQGDGVRLEMVEGDLRLEAEEPQRHWIDKLWPRKAEIIEILGGGGVNGEPPEPEPRRSPKLLPMSDVEPRPLQWLWPGRVAKGRLSLLVGMPGCGKSFLTVDMAVRITTGTPWPDGHECQRGSVLLVTAEDDPSDTIRPRLDAHRADVSRVHLLSGIHSRGDDGDPMELSFTLRDVDMLEESLRQIEDCRLVVVDPIGSFLGGRTDSHRDNEVRGVLAPVAQLAERYGPAVLVVAHRRKTGGAVADDMALGSRAFTGIARSVWHLSRDTEDRNRRLLLPGKCNLAAEPTGLAFSIVGEPASVTWEPEPVTMTADDALAREGDKGEASAIDEAMAWLSQSLADGPRPGKELKTEAKGAGLSLRTLDRAKARLNVEAGPDGFGGPWVWRLPECARVRQDFAECANVQTLAHTGETVAHSDDWGEI